MSFFMRFFGVLDRETVRRLHRAIIASKPNGFLFVHTENWEVMDADQMADHLKQKPFRRWFALEGDVETIPPAVHEACCDLRIGYVAMSEMIEYDPVLLIKQPDCDDVDTWDWAQVSNRVVIPVRNLLHLDHAARIDLIKAAADAEDLVRKCVDQIEWVNRREPVTIRL